MAQGDIIWIDNATRDIWQSVHDLTSDQLESMLVTDTGLTRDKTAIAKSDFTECSATGYAAVTLASVTFTEAANVWSLKANAVTHSQATGSESVRFQVIYNQTAPGDLAICAYDLGGAVDVSSGDIVNNFGSTAVAGTIHTVTVS